MVALPVGWFAGVLVDRIPERLPLFDPLEKLRLTGQYLWIHLIVLALFVAIPLRLPVGTSVLELAVYLVLAAMLVTVSVIDLITFRLPDHIIVPASVACLALVVISSALDGDVGRIKYALAGAGFYFGFLLVVHLISPRGMGFGDVKMAGVMGLCVGWMGDGYGQSIALVLWAMMIGFVIGSVFGLVMLVRNRRSRGYPFGPFLAIGALAVVLLGSGLVVAN